MAFDKYRDASLEDALIKFDRQKHGSSSSGRAKCLITKYVDEGAKSLNELNDFVMSRIGRNIQADDFCKLARSDGYQAKGFSCLTFEPNAREFSTIMEFCKRTKSVFSADALLLERDPDHNVPIKLMKRFDTVGKLFDPELWQYNPQALNDLKAKVTVDIGQFIDICIAEVTKLTAPSIDGDIDRSLVLGRSGKASPFVAEKNWDRLAEIQAKLGKQNERLTLTDMVATDLPNGTPLIVQAAKMGKLEEALALTIDPTDWVAGASLLSRKAKDQTVLVKLAEFGQVVPVLQALGLSIDDIAKATDKLSAEQKVDNGLDALVLRQQLRSGENTQPVGRSLLGRFGF
jgi:hypothetical protein